MKLPTEILYGAGSVAVGLFWRLSREAPETTKARLMILSDGAVALLVALALLAIASLHPALARYTEMPGVRYPLIGLLVALGGVIGQVLDNTAQDGKRFTLFDLPLLKKHVKRPRHRKRAEEPTDGT